MRSGGQKLGFHCFALILSSLFIFGCSGSGSNVVEGTQSLNDAQTNVQTDVPDPMIQLRTRVDLEITVPAYQSDALQVKVQWGGTESNAAWIGDELWALSLDLLSDTEYLLTITFSDNNGQILLGSYEYTYHTGFNDAEFIQVTAQQFNSERWDTDEDGVSNLEELIKGLDPLVNEDLSLPIQEYSPAVEFFVERFESHVTEERPLSITFAPHPNNPDQDSLSGTLDVDTEGDGALIHNEKFGSRYTNLSGIRTHSQDSVSWEGDIKAYDGTDYLTTANLTSTVSRVDDQTYKVIYEINRRSVGTYVFDLRASADFQGKLVDETSQCEPVAGTYSSSFVNGVERTRKDITISKAAQDSYWRVVTTTESLNHEDGTETTEYFARDLIEIEGAEQVEFRFKCDFVDYQPQ